MQDLERQVTEANEKASIAMSLVAKQKEEEAATIATANSTISSITDIITAATQNSQQKNKDDGVNKQFQMLIDLIQNQCNQSNNTNNQSKQVKTYANWKLQPPATTDPTMDTPDGKVYWKTNANGKMFYWCDKCSRFTPTHNSHTHKGPTKKSE